MRWKDNCATRPDCSRPLSCVLSTKRQAAGIVRVAAISHRFCRMAFGGLRSGAGTTSSLGLREQLGSVHGAGWEAVRLSRPVVGTSGARGRRRRPFSCRWCETERFARGVRPGHLAQCGRFAGLSRSRTTARIPASSLHGPGLLPGGARAGWGLRQQTAGVAPRTAHGCIEPRVTKAWGASDAP